MVAPIDYTAGQAAPTDFLRSIQGGLQVGAQIQQQQQAAVQQQAAQVAAAAYSADAQSAMANPTPQAFAALALKYPSQREAVKQSWDGLSDAEKKSEGDTMSQAYSALLAGKPDVAKSVVQNQIDARKNSGLDTSHFDSALQLLDTDPQKAQAALGFTLSHIGDPKDFATKFGALQGEQRAEDLAPAALRSANAKAGGEEADTSQKSLAVVGSTLGALQGKNAKPEQVQTALKSLAAKGLITKDDLPGYIAAIPTDAKQRDEWLGSLQMAGLTPEQQAKLTMVDANTAANNKTQLQTTSMNNATQIKTTSMNNATQRDIQASIDKRQESKGDAEASLDTDTLNTMAAQYLAGDKSVMQNLGRGAQGSANIVALRKEITAQAKAQGLSGPQIAAQMSDYAGLTAGIRTSAQISARIENAAAEASQLAPLAVAAGREVSRSGFLPFGKAQVMFGTQTNDPALKKFATANIGLATAYANAMARGQKATVDDNKHARDLLSTATSQPAYEAVVSQMQQEIAAARRAPEEVRSNLRSQIGGGKPSSAAPLAPALPGGWSVKVHP